MAQIAPHTTTDPLLWARIRGAHLPVERDGRSFAEHLAERAGLSPAAARALETEYRRYLYLAVVAEARCVPPGLVRLAWDYHAGLDGYGEDFCPWVLGRRLMPRDPAAPDDPGYGATWARYRAEFGSAPPEPLWPAPEPRWA